MQRKENDISSKLISDVLKNPPPRSEDIANKYTALPSQQPFETLLTSALQTRPQPPLLDQDLARHNATSHNSPLRNKIVTLPTEPTFRGSGSMRFIPRQSRPDPRLQPQHSDRHIKPTRGFQRSGSNESARYKKRSPNSNSGERSRSRSRDKGLPASMSPIANE